MSRQSPPRRGNALERAEVCGALAAEVRRRDTPAYVKPRHIADKCEVSRQRAGLWLRQFAGEYPRVWLQAEPPHRQYVVTIHRDSNTRTVFRVTRRASPAPDDGGT